MENPINVTVEIFKYWFWQDVEKSHIIPRFLSLGFSTFLSLVLYWTISGLNINIFFKYLLIVYSIVNILSFWPYYNFLYTKSTIKGTFAYIFKKLFIPFSFFFLVPVALNNNKEELC